MSRQIINRIKETIGSHITADNNDEIPEKYFADIELPIKQIKESADRIHIALQASSDAYANKLMSMVIYELLTCQIRFFTGIYVSVFLQDDYKNDIDERVFNYFKGIYNTYNEFIGLNEELSFFLKKNQPNCHEEARPFYINLYKVNFRTLKLKTPPIYGDQGALAAQHYIDFGNHVMAVMEKLISSFSFFNDLKLKMVLNQRCYDNLSIFGNAARTLLNSKKLPQNPKKKLEQYTGDCFLCINGKLKIRLDPTIIPLKNNNEISPRLAVLKKFSGYNTADRSPILYHELIGDGTLFNTSNPKLFRKLFVKRGLVSEEPSFTRQYKLSSNNIELKLYTGDIFELNFLGTHKRMAMVNLLNRDLSCKTPLSISLEALDGDGFLKDLKKQANGKAILEKNRLYITRKNIEKTKPGTLECKDVDPLSEGLKFDYIFHCPIYATDEKQDNNLQSIKTIINQIIKACSENQVECLVVPAMGSFYAGQVRREVANLWYNSLKQSNFLTHSQLKKIIFSFINEETCNEYHKVFSTRTDKQFEDYHLPIYLMHNNISTSTTPTQKIDNTLDLCSYLYCFMTAWAIRSLMWEKSKMKAQRKPFLLNTEQKKFVTELCINAGLIPSEVSAWSKGISFGRWRDLTKLGFDALASGNNAWNFEKWYGPDEKRKLEILIDFMSGGGNYDYPELRNSRAHSIWHNTKDQKGLADDSVIKIIKIIQNMPFLKSDKNKMTQIKRFSVLEDTDAVNIDFIQLDGNRSLAPSFGKKPNSKKEALDGQLFELDAVYLIENLDDESVKALNLHPFVLYGPCETCRKPRLYIWRDFVVSKDQSLEIEYGSTGCGCKIADDSIATYNKKGLSKRFINILEQLKGDMAE